MVGVLVVLVAAGAYALFFAPTPAIEIIVPPTVRSTAELSKVEFDPSSVANSEAFRALRRYVGEPTLGQVGRSNPFIKF